MTTQNKRKLAALNKENCKEHPRSNLAQNSIAPRSQEEYITQVSEEIEGRVTKRLSKEFSRTENRILGALARLDDFLMNPLPTRSVLRNNQGTNEDDSQNDPHPEAGLFHSQSARNAGPEDDRDMVTGVQRESQRPRHSDSSSERERVSDRDMVTGVQRERVSDRDMVTGATEQIGN